MRLLTLSAGLVLAAFPALAQSDPGLFGSPFRFTETSGASVYRYVCTGCHMADGKGATGAGTYPALAGDPNLAVAGYPVGVIVHGQRAMPSFARLLTDQQIAEVADYIRHSFGNSFDGGITEAEVKAAR